MLPPVGYLEEQRDVVLDALRHGGDLIARKAEPWGTTIWTRTAEDAENLRGMLYAPLRMEAAKLGDAVAVKVNLVEEADGDGGRWGVRVELRFLGR